MALEKKSNKVRRLVATGEYKAALSIAKGFRVGISREDIGTMTRGFECMVHPGFYAQLGMDESYEIDRAIKTVKKLYGTESKGENR